MGVRSRPADLRAAFPLGIATAQQLMAVGIRESTVYRRCLDDGPWRRLLPGVVALFTGRPTREQYVRAALLLGGPDALVTGLEACRRHGMRRGPLHPLDGEEPAEVHILVPAGRQVRSVGYVHVERTYRRPAAVTRQGVPLAPVPRACVDAVRRLPRPGDVTELLSDAVQRGFCTVPQLAHELESGSRRGTAVPRAVLRDVAEGVRSAAERQAKQLWEKAGLPEARWNVDIHDADGRFLGKADCWIDDVAMVWETESTEWHLSPADHDATVERAARFTAAGAVYIATKPRKIRTAPQEVAALLRAAYEQARARPRPHLNLMQGKPHSLRETQ
jgi:hypothetical protein